MVFTAEEHASFLTPEQRDALLKLHPDGTARFWGTFDEPNRERYLRETGPGAAVVFTASSHARGVGVIGAVFKNPAFADTLWAPDAEKGSYALVYSVLEFEETAIPTPRSEPCSGRARTTRSDSSLSPQSPKPRSSATLLQLARRPSDRVLTSPLPLLAMPLSPPARPTRAR